MKVIIQSAPEKLIRAFQMGDWEYTTETILAWANQDIESLDSQFALGIHEAVEAYLCRKHGITDKQVVEFDEMFEAERNEGKHAMFAEAGDAPRAPYLYEHQAATHVERAVCNALGITWEQHEKNLT